VTALPRNTVIAPPPGTITPALPTPIALLLAVVAGWIMDLGHPDVDIWPMTLIGAP